MMNYYFNVESIINLASLATRFVEKPHEDRYVKAINELKGKESERSSVDKLIETILSDQDLSPREKADLINTVETQYYNRKVEYTKSCADIIDKGMEKKITAI